MYLGYQKGKIVLTAQTEAELANNKFMKFDEIKFSEVEYTIYNGEYLTQEEIDVKEKEVQKKELIKQLDEIDLKTIRALRAIQSGNGTQEDTAKLAELEQQAETIRQQIKSIGEQNENNN